VNSFVLKLIAFLVLTSGPQFVFGVEENLESASITDGIRTLIQKGKENGETSEWYHFNDNEVNNIFHLKGSTTTFNINGETSIPTRIAIPAMLEEGSWKGNIYSLSISDLPLPLRRIVTDIKTKSMERGAENFWEFSGTIGEYDTLAPKDVTFTSGLPLEITGVDWNKYVQAEILSAANLPHIKTVLDAHDHPPLEWAEKTHGKGARTGALFSKRDVANYVKLRSQLFQVVGHPVDVIILVAPVGHLTDDIVFVIDLGATHS
jgi:hypothetical protein